MTNFADNFIWIVWLIFIIHRAIHDAQLYFNWQEDTKLLRIKNPEVWLPPYINHKKNVIQVLCIAAVLYLLSRIPLYASSEFRFKDLFELFQIGFYALGCAASYWLIFDLLFNIFVGLPALHVGTEAWWDKLQTKLPIPPHGWIFFKFLLAFMGIYMYYNVELL